jgi:hypothetical protein
MSSKKQLFSQSLNLFPKVRCTLLINLHPPLQVCRGAQLGVTNEPYYLLPSPEERLGLELGFNSIVLDSHD